MTFQPETLSPEAGAVSHNWWLMFEDDQVDVMTVERALRRLERPIDLVVVPNGLSPLEQLRDCQTERKDSSPSLILLDINLPLGSGHETLARLKGDPATRRIPIVVLSTSDQERDVSSALAAGAAGYFVKPPGFAEFQRLVQTLADYWHLSQPVNSHGGKGDS